MARFLFPDDDQAIRNLCRTVVDLEGHVCELAVDGEDGKGRAEAIEHDGLVSDGLMPGMHGPQMLDLLRPWTEGRVPTAIKSAMHFSPERLSAVGADWYVPKPFDMYGLFRVCREMLRARIDKLLDSRPDRETDFRGDGDWVDLSVLEAALHMLDPAQPRQYLAGRRAATLYTSSPRTAIRVLALAVRSWSRMGDHLCTDPPWEWMAARLNRSMDGDIVALGDEDLRREVAREPEPLRTQLYLALCCARFGWQWQVGPEVVLEVQQPDSVVRDEGGALHNEEGAAICYRDGWQVHALRGIRVPRHVVLEPERITIDEIRGERNAEVKRLLRERFGEERYIAKIGAVLLDVDTVPVDLLASRGRAITRALIEDSDGVRFLVASDGSTKRVYHMQVPSLCTTCEEAYEALSGRSGVRTLVQA